MAKPFSCEFDPGFPERVTNLFAELVADLTPDAVSKFLRLHDGTVDGTNQFVISVDLDADALDAKLRAALRAVGFDLDGRLSGHNESPHGCVDSDMIGPGAVGIKSTASAIEARAKRLFGECS